MKKIKFNNPHRKKHFDFFNAMNHPHFNITANVDVSRFLEVQKMQGLPLTFSLVYLLSEAANRVKEFRWRIRDKEVVEHDKVHPSFTVPTDNADVFSFCSVAFRDSMIQFIEEAERVSAKMKTDPSFEDEEGRDDYLFMSAIPWVSFTSIQHAMSYHPHDSVPRISWGKFFEQNGKTQMPLAVQAHHAIVDGSHMGKFFEVAQANLNEIQ